METPATEDLWRGRPAAVFPEQWPLAVVTVLAIAAGIAIVVRVLAT